MYLGATARACVSSRGRRTPGCSSTVVCIVGRSPNSLRHLIRSATPGLVGPVDGFPYMELPPFEGRGVGPHLTTDVVAILPRNCLDSLLGGCLLGCRFYLGSCWHWSRHGTKSKKQTHHRYESKKSAPSLKKDHPLEMLEVAVSKRESCHLSSLQLQKHHHFQTKCKKNCLYRARDLVLSMFNVF